MGNRGRRVTDNKNLHYDHVFDPGGEPGDIAYRCVVYTMQRFDVGNMGGTKERRPTIEGHVDHDLGAPIGTLVAPRGGLPLTPTCDVAECRRCGALIRVSRD